MNISVRQLCCEYLNSKNQGSDEFRRLYRIATLEGVREFNMDITGRFVTELLTVSANYTVPFPCDFLDWSMIGIINDQGEAVSLDFNESLVSVKQAFIAGKGIVDTPNVGDTQFIFGGGQPLFNVFFNYSWGGNFINLYGLGGGTPSVGDFNIDYEAKCILISPNFQYGSILLEYLSNGFDENRNDYSIHTFASTAFLAWLRWHDNIDKKGVSDSKIRSLALAYGNQKQKAKYRMNQARINEMVKVQRKNIKLAAKA